MLVKVTVDIYLDVKDEGQAEEACMAMEALDNVLRNNNFPHGDVVQSDTHGYAALTKAEMDELGFEE